VEHQAGMGFAGISPSLRALPDHYPGSASLLHGVLHNAEGFAAADVSTAVPYFATSETVTGPIFESGPVVTSASRRRG
jgi:hypothetical protein